METRIEIYKDDKWQALRLADNVSIKYNTVINRVGKVASREISHTNTFSLPHVYRNIQVLGLNVFNPKDLAKAMNAKYIANYYVEDKLLQTGFIVINNTNGGTIKVNFIDESLELTARWGSTTFQELLQDEVIEFPADYATAISELRNYDMDKNTLLTKLPQVGTRGYSLCSFPNNLNAIGDKFQIDTNGLRQDDVFNPYQSRPLFNVKSLFDLATTSFGYTPIYDDSVDWDLVATTYMVNDGQDQNKEGENGTQTIQHPFIGSSNPYYSNYNQFLGLYTTQAFFQYSSTISLKPNDIPHFVGPFALSTTSMSQNIVIVPNVDSGNVGTMQFIGDFNQGAGGTESFSFYAIWKNATPGGDTISELLPTTHITQGTTYQIDFTLDKVQFNTIPAGADSLIGVIFSYGKGLMQYHPGPITNMTVEETYLPEGVVAFDQYGQYLPDVVDLAHNAPQDSIKELLSAAMHKEGILMDINAKAKTVKFFNYGEYEAQRVSGDFSDWSQYLIREGGFVHNTDYGTNYAKKNRVGLSDPYQGNYYDIVLENQGLDSKYKDFKVDSISKFKDVSNVVEVDNTTTPYFEFTHEGLGLVELDGTLGTLEQERADGTSQGSFSGLDKFANVNYARIPDGVKLWYSLVDEAIRVEADFLLPVDIVKSLDMSEPIYVEELGGFYIIEEIKEYTNGSNPVKVKLIKLIDNFRGLEAGAGIVLTPSISLTSVSTAPSPPSTFNYSITSTISFNNYTPSTGVSITLSKLDGSGGTLTGASVTETITPVSPYSGQQHIYNASFPITTSEEGYYQVQVEDSVQGLSSAIVEVYLGDEFAPSPTVDFTVVSSSGGVASTTYSYNNFSATPTFATLEYQLHDATTMTATGTLRTLSFPTTPSSGTQSVTFLDGAGFYVMTLKTNEADSQPPILGGTFIL